MEFFVIIDGMLLRRFFWMPLGIGIVLLAAACSPEKAVVLSPTVEIKARVTVAELTLTQTPPPTSTMTPTETSTSTATLTATVTPQPTVASLRVKVIPDQVVCHYGPGKPYLYKYALIGGSNLEAIARIEYGDFLEVRAFGGTNPCWVNPEWLEINGDALLLNPIPADGVNLPLSPYYAPLTGVSAVRDGNTVTVTWNPLTLRAGDDSEQVPYLVEAWICQAGEYKFAPMGAYETSITINDEPGCSLPSRARVLAAEKHGYTRPVELVWPAAPTAIRTPQS